MAGRYIDRRRIPGRLSEEVFKLMLEIFDSESELQGFIRRKLESSFVHSIAWKQPFRAVCGDVEESCTRYRHLGVLLEGMTELKPGHAALDDLIAYLVAAGYLNDNTKEPIASTNPHNVDWYARYGMASVSTMPDKLAEEISKCFPSSAALERFLGDNFSDGMAREMLQVVKRKQPVIESVRNLVRERNYWMRCVIMSVVSRYPDVSPELSRLAAQIDEASKATVIRTTPPAPQPTVIRTASPAPKPSVLQVVRVGKLSGELINGFVEKILSCYTSIDDLKSLMLFKLDVRLDHIVSCSGTFSKICKDLVLWCIDQDDQKLTDLLNAILKERPGRGDVQLWVQKLASQGVVELQK